MNDIKYVKSASFYRPPLWLRQEFNADESDANRLFIRYNYLKFLNNKKASRVRNNEINKIRDELVKRFYPIITILSRKIPVSSHHDFVSDGALVLLRAIEAYDASKEAQFKTYLSVSLNNLRLRKPSDSILESIPDAENEASLVTMPEEVDESEYMKKQIRRILSLLESREREYIRLRFFDGLTYADIAKALKCSKETCRRLNKTVVDNMRVAAKVEGVDIEGLL